MKIDKITAIIMCGVLALAGCGGKAPNPVSQYQPGDEQRTCVGLKSEIAANEAEIAKLAPGEDATGKNVALGVAGAFVIVPWFFMDFKDGEAVEIQALKRRNQWLREIAYEKDCGLPPPTEVTEEMPTPTEVTEEVPSADSSAEVSNTDVPN